MTKLPQESRRIFHRRLAAGAASVLTTAPRVHAAEGIDQPVITSGVASGDVTQRSAVLWSRADRPAQMIVELADNDAFRASQRIEGPAALHVDDLTAKTLVSGLNPGQPMFYRVCFRSLTGDRQLSEPVVGNFLTAPTTNRDVNFVWSGDTAGQGYGIDLARGGMRTYHAMQQTKPDFFVHCGDHIYADNPILPTMRLEDGSTWENLVLPGTEKVAETLTEFHANFRYNLLDPQVRDFNAHVPMYAQWDDHETTNNWYPGEQLVGDQRYAEKSASLLAARSHRAFFNYMPIRPGRRIYRTIQYGPLVDLFFLDMRSYRGANSKNRQQEPSDQTALLGRRQLKWLTNQLLSSGAAWKVVCSDMPLGLMVRDGDHFENVSNGEGPPLGREHELAELLAALKAADVKNIVWLTADVHYSASHYYDPNRAVFKDFLPFWEFVSGPLHAGTFGPGELDPTFGPEVKFCGIPDDLKQNRPPSEGFQFFGQVQIDGRTRRMTVTHLNRAGKRLWSVDLDHQSV